MMAIEAPLIRTTRFENGGVSSESAPPVPVACNRDRMPTSLAVLIDGEHAADRGLDARVEKYEPDTSDTSVRSRTPF